MTKDNYIELAKKSLTYYIENNKPLPIPDEHPLLKLKAACFVTLYKNGQLRGCIGTLEPVKSSLWEEIRDNAISSGLRDPRFKAVTEEELDSLVYSVDVLGKPEVITNIEVLDPQLYGVIVRKGYRTGVLLPMLDGVKTVEQQLSIALQKAGIGFDETYEISRFKVERHEET